MRPEQVDAIKSLATQDGKLEAINVVDAARHSDSILHELFEWNDGIAAEMYRIDQARGLIRKISVVYIKQETKTYAVDIVRKHVNVPRFVKDSYSHEGYQDLTKIDPGKDRYKVYMTIELEMKRIVGNFERTSAIANNFGSEILEDFLSRCLEIVYKYAVEYGLKDEFVKRMKDLLGGARPRPPARRYDGANDFDRPQA